MAEINTNNSDFGGFLRYLDDEECFDFESIVQVVEDPYKWETEYSQYHNYVKVKAKEGSLIEGFVSDCCCAEVVLFDEDDHVCVNCFKECDTEVEECD